MESMDALRAGRIKKLFALDWIQTVRSGSRVITEEPDRVAVIFSLGVKVVEARREGDKAFFGYWLVD